MNITFHTFMNAIRYYWKTILAVTLIFALLGAGGGWYYGQQQARPAQGAAQVLSQVDLSEQVYDANYYATCRNALNVGYGNLEEYFKILFGEVTLSAEKKASLKEFQLKIQGFETEILKPILDRFAERNALYFPEEFLDELIEYYENLVAKNRDNLLQAEIAVDIIKNMDTPELTNEEVMKAYQSLLSAASNYGKYKVNELQYTEILERLNHESVKIKLESRQLFRDIEAAAEELNDLIEEVSLMANTIAAENHFNLTVAYNEKGVSTTSILHTHRENDPQEIFQVLTVFCTLVGICVGGFFAVCRQAKRDEKEEKEKSQMVPTDKAENAT